MRDTGGVLQVLCAESELAEYGEVIAIGDHVSRLAARIEQGGYGTDLDAVRWWFDQYAQVTGREAARVSGTVRTISAVLVRSMVALDRVWRIVPGSARLEDLITTDSGYEPVVLAHRTASTRSDDLQAVGTTPASAECRSEHLSGWLFALDDERIDPV